MIVETTKLAEGNRIVIPARIRKEMGLKQGDTLSLSLDAQGQLHVRSPDAKNQGNPGNDSQSNSRIC